MTLNSTSARAIALAVFTLPAATEAQELAYPADSAAVMERVQNARRLAGAEWARAAEYLCAPGQATPQATDPPIVPTRVFDNLYQIGNAGTVVYALTTSDGIILIDAGYAGQAESVVEAGLRTVGLDPSTVKVLIITHGHADHFGGASHFQERYGTRVVMAAADWALVEQPAQGRGGRGGREGGPAARPPKRDIEAAEGQPLTLGDQEVVPVLVPGHTPGSLGLIFRVRDGRNLHVAGLFGGTILAAERISTEGLQQYLRSLSHWGARAAALRVDVGLQNHPLFDNTFDKTARLRVRETGGSHPFVVGQDAYARFVAVMSECMQATLARR